MARTLFPAFLDLAGRRVLVVGAGRVAASKIPRLLDAGASVVVVAPDVMDDVASLPLEIHRRAFVPADLAGAWYVVSAAPPAVNAAVAYEATVRGVFVNAVDDPRHATAFAGSVLTRGPVTVAISTGGEAPALARVLREALDRIVGRDVEDWTALAASLRHDWKRERVPMERRRDALLDALVHLAKERDSNSGARAWPEVGTASQTSLTVRSESSDGIRPAMHPRGRRCSFFEYGPDILSRRAFHPTTHKPRGGGPGLPTGRLAALGARRYFHHGLLGFVSLVGAGPGDPELLTRKAARRLAEADLVLYDALASSAVVSLAVNAQQILVGRRRGSETMGQEAIVRTLIRAARRGKRVVRLKGGDPFVFGRGGEEALALRAAGVDYEIVPGVSSAFAAAAAASIPVTHRGVSEAVLVTSGHDQERFARSVGAVDATTTTLVVMMGTAHREDIVETLLDSGWPASTPAAVVCDATLPEQTVWTGQLSDLPVAPHSAAPGTIVIGRVVALRDAMRRESRKGSACYA